MDEDGWKREMAEKQSRVDDHPHSWVHRNAYCILFFFNYISVLNSNQLEP